MIDTFGSSLQGIATAIYFLLGFIFLCLSSPYFKTTPRHAALIYIWHSLWCLVYLIYSFYNSADSIDYFLQAENRPQISVGSPAVIFFTYLIREYINASYIGAFCIFNIFGSFGLLAFDSSIRHFLDGNSRGLILLAKLIVFLPGVSFWSSAIGKDSVAFMSTGFLLWAWVDLNRRYIFSMFAIITMFLVRPHIAMIALISLFISSIFDKNHKNNIKRIQACLFFGLIILMLPFAIAYSGLSIDGVTSILDYIKFRQELNTDGGSSIDFSEMSLPYLVLSYLFKPFFFDATNITQFGSSIDNLILVLFFLKVTADIFPIQLKYNSPRNLFLLVYSISCLILLSMTTANLGIAVRQKWLFLPALILYALVSTRSSRRYSPQRLIQ